MKLAVISDIHGNYEALLKVLADIDRQDIATIISLGDNIGYGPMPEEVIKEIRHRSIPSIMGNHEWALASSSYRYRLNPTAKKSLQITRDLMSKDSIDYCRNLPRSRTHGPCLLVHGCPPASPTAYLFKPSAQRLRKLLATYPEEICFFGHTHNLALIEENGERITTAKPGAGEIILRKGNRYLINVGSVGQPRDGDNAAKYVIWNNENRTLTVRFVPYDIAETADKIIALGFPESNAKRLW